MKLWGLKELIVGLCVATLFHSYIYSHDISYQDLDCYLGEHQQMLDNPYTFVEGVGQLALICSEGSVHRHPELAAQLFKAIKKAHSKLPSYEYSQEHVHCFQGLCALAVDFYADQYRKDQLCYWHNGLSLRQLHHEQKAEAKSSLNESAQNFSECVASSKKAAKAAAQFSSEMSKLMGCALPTGRASRARNLSAQPPKKQPAIKTRRVATSSKQKKVKIGLDESLLEGSDSVGFDDVRSLAGKRSKKENSDESIKIVKPKKVRASKKTSVNAATENCCLKSSTETCKKSISCGKSSAGLRSGRSKK